MCGCIHNEPRTAAHHAHGEDGVMGDLWVGVVGELAERVQDVEAWVGHGDQGQRQRHRAPQGGLSVPQLHNGEGGLQLGLLIAGFM